MLMHVQPIGQCLAGRCLICVLPAGPVRLTVQFGSPRRQVTVLLAEFPVGDVTLCLVAQASPTQPPLRFSVLPSAPVVVRVAPHAFPIQPAPPVTEPGGGGGGGL